MAATSQFQSSVFFHVFVAFPFYECRFLFYCLRFGVFGKFGLCWIFPIVILITRQRERTLAEGAVRQENLAVNSDSNEWPAPPPPVQQSTEPLFRSFLRSINRSPRAEEQAQALSVIPTPSECRLAPSRYLIVFWDEWRLGIRLRRARGLYFSFFPSHDTPRAPQPNPQSSLIPKNN